MAVTLWKQFEYYLLLYMQEVWHASGDADDCTAAVCPGAASLAQQAWREVVHIVLSEASSLVL